MKFREYAASKAVTLCFLGIAVLIAAVAMAYHGTGVPVIAMTGGGSLLLTAGWLVCGYYSSVSRLNKLRQLEEALQEKYLLAELLPAPKGEVERQYFELMRTVSRSAVGIAEQAQREKEEYCDYVESWIHEIRTPLTACSLILSNDADPRSLRRELKRADNLTESILYYARLRTAEKDLQVKRLHVASVMDEAVKSQMELLIAAGIGVELQGDFIAYTDDKPLCFILKQLLINCAKYCPGCHVAMTAENGTLTVCDDGIGIPGHELRRVTERGFTGSSGKRTGGGTGMGLYIVKGLCERLGIRLDIESEPAKYTRITMRFGRLTEM